MANRGGHYGAMEAMGGGSGSVPGDLGKEVIKVTVKNILNGKVREIGLGERDAHVIREGVALTGEGLVRRRMQIVTAPGQNGEPTLVVVYTDHKPVMRLGRERRYENDVAFNHYGYFTFFPDLIIVKRNI